MSEISTYELYVLKADHDKRVAELEAELAEALTAIRRYNEQFRYIADGGGFYLSTAAEGSRLSHSFLARHGEKS